jgi:KDO2-lipid IV(A) lauroyltransferase
VLSKELALYRAGAVVASALPGEVAGTLVQGVGALMGRLPDYNGRRAVAASHMARVLGRPLAPREQRRMVAEVFANYGRYWAESLRLPSRTKAEILDGVTTFGWEHLEAALAGGKGVIVGTPHLGGWEWGAMYLIAKGIPVTVAVEPLRPPDLFDWFARFRRELGMQVVPVGPGAAGAILQALKDGHVVCLLSDRVVAHVSGSEVSFFGAPVMLPAGPVTLALRSGAPLMTAAIYYGKQATAHTLVFRPPFELPPTGRFRQSVQSGTQILAIELEHLIRSAPTQWHLVQPNWPDDPPLHKRWARPARAMSPDQARQITEASSSPTVTE